MAMQCNYVSLYYVFIIVIACTLHLFDTTRKMRLIVCFLWTYMLLTHNCVPVVGVKPFGKMGKNFTCGAMRQCAERAANGQVCGCDWSCEMHGDCCPDYTRPGDGPVPPDDTRPGDGSVPAQETSLLYPSPISCVDTTVDGGYLLVSTCPTHWKPDHISVACESDWYGMSPAYTVPVASRKTHISYKNMFCAYCHGQTMYDIKLWSLLHDCRANITFGTMFVEAADRHRSSPSCHVRCDESTRRRCVVGARDCRGVDVRGDKSLMLARDMCNRYTDYAATWRNVYKNVYCYQCHRSVDPFDVYCVETADVLENEKAALSQLAHIYDHTDYKYYKDPALSYEYMKEEDVVCTPPKIYYRKKCTTWECPYRFEWNVAGQQCEVKKVEPDFLWCNPGWDTSESPIQYIGASIIGSSAMCANRTGYVSRRVSVESGDAMMESIRAVLGSTNYRQLLVSWSIAYDGSMFGNCQSTTTVGPKADNNAQLLAFMERASSNLTWPWTVNLTVVHTDGGMGQGNVSACELVPMCRTYFIPSDSQVGSDTPTMFFWDRLYICEDVFKHMVSKEREERNVKLAVFLKRAETISVPTSDCGVRTKMGVIIVVMVLIWVLH